MMLLGFAALASRSGSPGGDEHLGHDAARVLRPRLRVPAKTAQGVIRLN